MLIRFGILTAAIVALSVVAFAVDNMGPLVHPNAGVWISCDATADDGSSKPASTHATVDMEILNLTKGTSLGTSTGTVAIGGIHSLQVYAGGKASPGDRLLCNAADDSNAAPPNDRGAVFSFHIRNNVNETLTQSVTHPKP